MIHKPENFEETIGVKFKNPDLLIEALTHRSYLNEYPNWRLPHNERLEYLGDADIAYDLNPHLVRGLDYYTRTAFEVVHSGLGA